MAVLGAAIGVALLGAAAVLGAAQSALVSIADRLPEGVVDMAFLAMAQGLHVIGAAVAAIMLAGALAIAALLMRG
jgi:hypothetical protein